MLALKWIHEHNIDTSLKHYVSNADYCQQDNHWGEKKAPAKKRAPVHLFLKERKRQFVNIGAACGADCGLGSATPAGSRGAPGPVSGRLVHPTVG
jgi:hypothetical protein